MIPFLDNGHGGLIDGVYQTAGKRSPAWGQGTLFEGVFNREIVNGVVNRLKTMNKPYGLAAPEQQDIPLQQRVIRANKFSHLVQQNYNDQAYLLSVHANAGGGTGWEIFTTIGKTKADIVADYFIKAYKHLPIRHRADFSDGDGDKEANFYILKHTSCPAVLIECAFMDNQNDYNLLFDANFKHQLIVLTTNVITELYNVRL